MSIFTGSGVALVTPFTHDKKVNFDMLEKLIEFQIDSHTDALIICGTTGEASTLSDEEQIETIRVAVSIARKRVPVLAGAGSNYTEHGIELCVDSEKAGVDGLMLVTPYYNKTSQRGLVEHYRLHAASVDLPIIIYNVPSRTGLNILPETAKALSQIDTVVGIKEASGNIVQIAEIAELCGDNLDIYAGNDDYIVPVMSLGGKGVISTAANVIPKQVHDMTTAYLSGDVKTARDIQLGMLGLVRGLFCDVNPVPIKAALNLMGYDVGGYRAPLFEMDGEHKAQLAQVMKNYGLIA
ncbi:MAG: 4-hydroxy-tetrahydrodipicolinate synthase [Clostridiales bacterium]|jgi:4-hydroxy-tetrahydrodipicolinate synthase|nr:4-hydroxy-tetrahydrodipicolinate synthase [Clostridiales bacterium]